MKFQKGRIPWNKGLNGICKPNNGSFQKGKTKNEYSFKKCHIPINKGKKGLQEANSGSFKKGNSAWNKGINVKKYQEEKNIKIALQKLEIQRQEKIKEFEAKPKEKQTLHNFFDYKICVVEGQYIKCKKQKGFCSYWDFCFKKEENNG